MSTDGSEDTPGPQLNYTDHTLLQVSQTSECGGAQPTVIGGKECGWGIRDSVEGSTVIDAVRKNDTPVEAGPDAPEVADEAETESSCTRKSRTNQESASTCC